MERNNRPVNREKNVTGSGNGVHRQGQGLGTGSVGGGKRPTAAQSTRNSGEVTRSSGRSPLLIVIVLVVLLLGGGGGLLGNLFSGGESGGYGESYANSYNNSYSSSSGSNSNPGSSSLYSDLLPGGSLFSGSGSSSGWTNSSNTGVLNREVNDAAREKYTNILGDGQDQVTIMVYMCGTDLESRSAMASKDLKEMTNATLSENVNLLVYTGGCTQWQNSIVSSSVNQIYQVKDGGLARLESNAGTGSMTDPDTLTGFIQWCAENFPANRYELILWDHGGGSLSGYGYDQKNPKSGSMSLAALDSALSKAGLTYDFIGFDACLMATVENAAMLSRYADYLIASEETEPGIGWYYTNWLTELSAAPSMSALDVGKRIVDDFISTCNQQCSGQSTTLSVVDLAELGETLPADLSAFSQDLRKRITDGEYKSVSTARSGAREFARSSVIDQIDFVDFAQRLDTDEGRQLASVLLSAVKYNRTSSSMTNAYGLSVYFPLKKMSSVDTAVKTYDALGMDEDFTDCIREFASLEVSGQAASGGSNTAYSSLLGGLSSSSAGQSALDIGDLLSAFLGGDLSGVSGLSQSNSGFLTGRSLEDIQSTADYLARNSFDASALVWKQDERQRYILSLSDEQWELVQDVDLNLFYDDGEGYVDMGLDNIFSFDIEGNLVADLEGTWLSINNQPVAYYHLSTVEDGDAYTITGRVPAFLNGEKVNLIVIFTSDNPKGYVAGAQPVYESWETETVARGLLEIEKGDTLQFLCDFYSYDGAYQDSYQLGETMTVSGGLTVHDTYLGSGRTLVLYRFTDIYNQHYWTEALTVH